MDAAWAKTEWEHFIHSKTVTAIVTMESLAVTVFLERCISGDQHFTFDALKFWACTQAAAIVVLLMRHAWAGIESKVEGVIPAQAIKAIEDAATRNIITALNDKHPEAAAFVRAELAK